MVSGGRFITSESKPHTSFLSKTHVQKLSAKQQPFVSGIQDDAKSPLGCIEKKNWKEKHNLFKLSEETERILGTLTD